ncbi:gamma-glutamyltranspeptidase [Sistotremastrum suecicum HHB10207 ss-3]|uniref:Gamma-glutamyltranspeptidase n=1 Tax=Sistotremastrum suecicum HHB10207 ss-3 TaxID=1314776 RepID=A0A166GB87_9AGAM|nr:gamma-glutamyltranspeptidase [Sistotremastrum suecicum HHB10207 ss-3]
MEGMLWTRLLLVFYAQVSYLCSGGGGFMTIRVPSKTHNTSSEVFIVDFRETAPSGSNATMYQHDQLAARFGGLAVGVPGELRGLQEAHQRWGRLSWERLVAPSVALAAERKVDRELAGRLKGVESFILADPDWSDFTIDGRVLEEGEIVTRPALARTLQIIATEGPDAFYEGPIADALIKKIQSTGGIVTHEDLSSYKVRVDRALKGSYRGRTIYTPHAPSGGPVLLLILNLLEHYPDFILDGKTPINIHRMIEAMKFGFAARTKISDSLTDEDVKRMALLHTKEYSDLIFPNITDDTTHPAAYYNASFDVPDDHGTAHTSVVDIDGMAVAVTSTVNVPFGSRVLDPVTGVILNDEMDDFSTPGTPNSWGLWPSPYNYPSPGKRPLSSMVPIIIEEADGSFYCAIGAAGGSRIIGAVLQTVIGLDWGLDVSAAIESPRLHDQLFPSIVDMDSGFSDSVIYDLIGRGHNITVGNINRITSVVQAVMKKGDYIFAASDSRKNAVAAGY